MSGIFVVADVVYVVDLISCFVFFDPVVAFGITNGDNVATLLVSLLVVTLVVLDDDGEI